MTDDRTASEERAILTPEAVSRFWSRVDKAGPCWLWMAGRNGDGYGYATFNQVAVGAHRVAYLLTRGPIPAGLQLDHICRVRNCVNPEHLEAVPERVNLLRGINPAAINARKTHCIRGHEFTPENTRVTPAGKRQCRTCVRVADARLKRAKRRKVAT